MEIKESPEKTAGYLPIIYFSIANVLSINIEISKS